MGAEYVPTHRDIEPDPRFNSKLVTKFINCLMLDGKKSVATQVFYNALEIIEKRMTDVEPYTVFAVGLEKREASHRSPIQASWWCHLPGANSR